MKKTLLFLSVMVITLSQAQVSLVKDISPGSGNGIGNEIIALDNNVYFSADDGSNGFTLWSSDGTEINTLEPLLGSNLYKSPHNFNYWSTQNRIVFSAEVGTTGFELYANGVAFSNYNTLGSSDPGDISEFNNFLIFAATTTNNGREFAYAFFGSSVTSVEDINPGSDSSNPSGFTVLANRFYFAADDGTNGRELWSSVSIAPNSPSLLLDINTGSIGSNPDNFVVFNNKLYFSADDGTNGRELWVTDGTLAGTQMVIDLFSGSQGSNPTGLTVLNNFLIFTANHPSLGNEIFKMTTSESVTNLKNINSGSGSSSPFGYTVFNGELFFAADNGSGVELWKSGGFPSNTNLLSDINPTGESTPQGFTEYFGKLYFNADDGSTGRELWVTDGTNVGTVLVDDINTGASINSDPMNLTVAGNNLFFSADNGLTGRELFKYIDPTLSIANTSLDKIVLFPNPASDSFSIEGNIIIDLVTIHDIHGKAVKFFENNIESYDIQDLSTGLYFVTIATDFGDLTKKLIKK